MHCNCMLHPEASNVTAEISQNQLGRRHHPRAPGVVRVSMTVGHWQARNTLFIAHSKTPWLSRTRAFLLEA